MQARVVAGWITEADLAKQSEAAEAGPKNRRREAAFRTPKIVSARTCLRR